MAASSAADQVPSGSTASDHRAAVEPASSPASGFVSSTGLASSPVSAGMSSPQLQTGALTDSAHYGLLRKHRTICTTKKELDILVVGFSSHDSTVGSVLGRNCKEMRWKVMYDRDADPIDIRLHVQEHKLHSNEVKIECNGQAIFHGAGAHAKAKMTEDFRYEWSFRGGIKGINVLNFFEVNLPQFSDSGDTWFPATVTGQHEDGFFEVTAQECHGNGRITEVTYPAVHKGKLREAISQKPLAVPENSVMLEVPKDNPLSAVLSLANGEPVMHHFGKPSPWLTAAHEKQDIALKVSKDRTAVVASAGHQVLEHFVSGEVQAKNSEVERLRHSWTIQVGPFAEHIIEITKRYTLGKIITLLVDGEVLAESSAADMGCVGGLWQCKFRLIGERVLDFEVYKTNTDGGILNETGHVKERRRYIQECHVTIPNDRDFTTARLFIDTVPFTELPMPAQRYEEPNLTTTPLALLHTYGIATPYMVDQNAASNMMILASQALEKANNGRKAAGGWFALCCNARSVADGNDIKVEPRTEVCEPAGQSSPSQPSGASVDIPHAV